MSALRVVIDDAPLPSEEAVAFWKRFSTWMDDHPGDLAGFAQGEGLASIRPEMHDGAPVLVGSHSAPQVPYGNAPQHNAAKPAKAGKPGQPAKPRPGAGGSPALQGGRAKPAAGGGGGSRRPKGRG